MTSTRRKFLATMAGGAISQQILASRSKLFVIQ